MENLQWWQAPPAAGPVHSDIRIPGSKSMTNRALVLSALATGTSTIHGALISRDTELMMSALEQLGVKIARSEFNQGSASTTITVTPQPLHGGTIDCGLAGTVMRFLPAVAALAEGTVFFDGDPQARQRPMTTTLDALRDLGVTVDGSELPFTVTGTGAVTGGEVEIDASASSQFVSGLLLAGARFTHGLTIRHVGPPVPSTPHIDMTVDMLRLAGVLVHTPEKNVWHVEPGPINARTWRIEPDLSNAAPFLAGAAVTGGRVLIHDWPAATHQAGDAIRDILTDMGCHVEMIANGSGFDLEVHGAFPGELMGIDRDLSDVGELTPTIAAIATLATTPSRLTGITHLRGHETDRITALANEINGIGGDCTELAGGLEINPRPMRGGEWHTYADHRMATAGAIIGLVTPIKIENVETTAKTLPGFADMWVQLTEGAHA